MSVSVSGSEATEITAQIERRRRAVTASWEGNDAVVVIGAGEPIAVPGRGDLTYPFRTHSEYFYLTDRERPRGVLAFDPDTGWSDFLDPVSREEMLWEGAPTVDLPGVPVAGLGDWLSARQGCPIANLGAPVAAASDPGRVGELRRALNHVRRAKDAVELERMRAAERATRAGFAAILPLLEPGRTERAIQVELEAEFFRHGADSPAYGTIVAGGPNSAVLHFAPSARELRAGELVLIDAGGEYRGYVSDVSRTYPVSGSFTAEQSALHELVRAACAAATERCTAGTEFKDVHLTAARVIADGLADFGLLRGRPETLVERGAVSLFFPHGIGHMVGLGVRDASEVLPGRPADPLTSPGLRTDLPLAAGHVVTVEPGIYFVPALLRDPAVRERLRHEVDWERAEELLEFGGIRHENNVLVTDDGFEVLTEGIPALR